MQLNRFLVIVSLSVLAFVGCKKDTPVVTPPATDANVTIHFNHVAGAQKINVGSGEVYTTDEGQKIKVNLFRYFIHNARLVNSTTGAVIPTSVETFRLIDPSDPSRLTLDMGRVPNAGYDKLRFGIGIPADRNHTGAQTGDLDPSLGMIWTWSTGYIFTKVEGKYFDNSNVEQPFSNHFATDDAYIQEIEVPITLDLKSKNAHITVNYDLAKLYTKVDLNSYAFVHSDQVNDAAWILKIKGNYPSVFNFSGVTYE